MLTAEQLKQTFLGKRVLISGHSGFKGSWLTYMLHHLGAQVYGYSVSEPEDDRHVYFALGIPGIVTNQGDHLGDVRDYDNYRDVFDKAAPDFLFHLAAQALVSESYKVPHETVSTNVLGVLNALEILRTFDMQTTAVIVTSDKCYKNKEQLVAYKEDDEMGGDDPYSASKGAAELVLHSYLTSFPDICRQSGIASVRAGNVFGGGDWSVNRLVPDCARKILAEQVVEIRMPNAVRPWTFVVDILNGYLNLAAHLKAKPDRNRGSWNFASGETKTVEQVVKAFIEGMGRGSYQANETLSVGKESGLLLIDPDKARVNIGWKCRIDVDEAIHLTALWYKEQAQKGDMAEFSKRFLKAYFSSGGAT